MTWLEGVAPCRGTPPEVELARARVAASMFPDDREPARVGRYTMLHALGSGGMGVVYAAYDPELDRKVAIKILHALDRGSQQGLLREARVLARLSHPHIVHVHDVGTFDLTSGDGAQLVFVAMEFIEGASLTAWLRERPRSQGEIVGMLLEAGRGLAAAHELGIVHRDFKPDNVLVDRDGHARVVDFGLARAHGDRPAPPSSIDDPPSPSEDTPLYGGTLAYMSPEQRTGAPTAASTDQFSFCVTLWEALCGERPFAGKSLIELASNVIENKRRSPPAGVRLPRWLRSAMYRGLAPDPAARWPSLAVLLHALERGRARARIIAALAVFGTLALGVLAIFVAVQVVEQRRVAACEDEGAAIARVWNDEQREAVRSGLLATMAGHAVTTADAVMPWLDAHADAWSSARTEACLDARWSADLHERARWCLDERLFDLDALVGELRDADVETVTRAVPAAASLRRIDPCRDAVLLERLPAPPTDSREEVSSIRVELSRAGALRATGAYPQGLAAAEDALQLAEALGWPPSIAAARVQVGGLLDDMGKDADAEVMLESAFFEATRADALEEAITAAQELAYTVGYMGARYDDGERWSKIADAMRGRLPDRAGQREARSLGVLALIRNGKGAHEEAVALQERALAITEESLGADHPDVAKLLNNLALVRRAMGAYTEAAALHERALAIKEKTLGRDHPSVATSLNNLALVRRTMGDTAEATALHERALAILEHALGPDHPDVALSLNGLAVVAFETGDYEEAVRQYTRALAIVEKARGSEHTEVATVLSNLAAARAAAGANEEAIRLHERALAIRERLLPADHREIATSLNNLGVVHEAMGDYATAAALHSRALAILERTLGEDHPDVASCVHNLAEARAGLGELAGAIPLYERALTIWERALGKDHARVARPLMGLARVALAQHRFADARTFAERALAILESNDVPPDELSDTRDLLARIGAVEP